MPTTVAYITFQYSDNPQNLPNDYIANVIFDPPSEMSAPWVTTTFEDYVSIITDQKSTINNADAMGKYQVELGKEVGKAFEFAWQTIHETWDDPGLLQLVAWLFDPLTPQGAKDLIVAVNHWKDAIMYEYLIVKKTSIYYGYPYDLDYSFIGPSPCRFTDIFLMVRPEFQPFGWTPPDVSSYVPGTRDNPWTP
jgi:hypothetical protein